MQGNLNTEGANSSHKRFLLNLPLSDRRCYAGSIPPTQSLLQGV